MPASEPAPKHHSTSSTNSDNPVPTPSSTPSDASDILREAAGDDRILLKASLAARLLPGIDAKMDEPTQDRTTIGGEPDTVEQPSSSQTEPKSEDQVNGAAAAPPKAKKGSKYKKHHKHHKHGKKSKKAKEQPADVDSESSSSDDEESGEDDDSSSDESSSEEERRKQRSKKKARRRKAKAKKRKSKHHDSSDSDDESSDSDGDSSGESSDEEERQRKRHRKRRRSKRHQDEDDEEEEAEDEDGEADDDPTEGSSVQQLQRLIAGLNASGTHAGAGRSASRTLRNALRGLKLGGKQKKKKRRAGKRGSTLEFKRVDELWDSSIHNYKLKQSAEDEEDEFNEFVFTVRRKFDWENKYRNTVVDIKSTLLKEALQEVMKDVKGVSLVEDQPSVDPNMLFLYSDELKAHMKTLKANSKKEKKRKIKKRLDKQRAHCKVLLKYINEDYEEVRKTLFPMLKAGNITFDLLWALFKPNTIAFTNTYGSTEDPRCFKVDYANKESSFMRGEWYCVEGRYLEYDGKSYGMGDFEVNVDSFKGPRKITSLLTYPLKYHKEPEELKKKLIERGKRFVAMDGMNYRFHKGLAFQKRKKTVAKVNINGRIMVDPAIFRRIMPNYQISQIQAKEDDDVFDMDDSDGDDCSSCCCCDDSDEEDDEVALTRTRSGADDKDKEERTKYKVVMDKENNAVVVEVPVDENGAEIRNQKLEGLEGSADGKAQRQFTEEELLIASPVVLGFAFSEKLWLEFSLGGVRDIEWDEHAFDALVMPPSHKRIVKALVESHKFHAAKTIDDVIQGKGKGLVSVLHGPPGTGKTLTAEGIAELLKCPLYMVSAGELGTDPARLEHELQKILDIAHSWGAVLLLDEADVFLERREIHDIHRNALVSVFLRLLEYFQGILFLTTNRVETFDDAIQSRVHVALRYMELDSKARKEVWRMFVEKCRAVEGVDTVTFKESDFESLARKTMNGRQIKNVVRTAQALAVNEKEALSMDHIKKVLEVAESFDRDLKGGTGYLDAMRSYT
ncbi:MAG: hypothetical protein M1822_005165 [Bathelium mastoideum]|nr:MAG: hypothetical protein M1822_005165 [Bathelium mastoideum]